MVVDTWDDSSQFDPNEEEVTLEERSIKLLLKDYVEMESISLIMHVTFH